MTTLSSGNRSLKKTTLEAVSELSTASSKIAAQVDALLERPFARIVIPENDGSYRGEILEFPGCIASGQTASEALASLEDAARSWLEAAIANGQPIPLPVENTEFSGRLVLRLPKSLHKKASRLAERDGVSLNQFIVFGLAEQVGENMPARNIRLLDSVMPSGNNVFIAINHCVMPIHGNPASLKRNNIFALSSDDTVRVGG